MAVAGRWTQQGLIRITNDVVVGLDAEGIAAMVVRSRQHLLGQRPAIDISVVEALSQEDNVGQAKVGGQGDHGGH